MLQHVHAACRRDAGSFCNACFTLSTGSCVILRESTIIQVYSQHRAVCFCLAELRTQRQRAQGLWPPSNRLGREAGFVMTCFLAALAMGPISPLLPLAALAYFILMWTFWRYTVRLLCTVLPSLRA